MQIFTSKALLSVNCASFVMVQETGRERKERMETATSWTLDDFLIEVKDAQLHISMLYCGLILIIGQILKEYSTKLG
jgi:hypothetical protein